MKKITLFIYLFLFSTLLFSQTKVTIYGDDSYPPYSFLDSGRLTGIYTIILDRIFDQMPEYDVELKGMGWKRSLAQIQRGYIFALYPPYKRAERPFIEFDTPILDEKLVVYCRKEIIDKPRSNWPEDYYGLTIGNNAGFAIGGDKFWGAVKTGKITVQETKGTPNNLLKLIRGQVDCYMNDEISIKWELKKLMKEGRYDGESIVKTAAISSEQGYLGFASGGARYPYKNDFKKRYLVILKRMKESGEIDAIVKRFLE